MTPSPSCATCARHFHAQCFGRAGRRRISAARLQQVGTVEAGGRDLDQDFAGARHGPGNFAQHQPVIGAGIFEDDGFHEQLASRDARAHTNGGTLDAKERRWTSDDLSPAQETAGYPAGRGYLRPFRA